MADREQRRTDEKRLQRNREWIEWLAHHQLRRLRLVARRWAIAEQDVDDVVQTALANVLRSFGGPDDEQSAFSYAARAVANTALKAHRRHARKESRNIGIAAQLDEDSRNEVWDGALADRTSGDPLERVVERESVHERVERLLGLTDEQRTALVLAAAGYGTAEIAAALGVSERVARKRIEFGNRALRGRSSG
jgi:RNA polymerase sigma factor (sigma-70 family)